MLTYRPFLPFPLLSPLFPFSKEPYPLDVRYVLDYCARAQYGRYFPRACNLVAHITNILRMPVTSFASVFL